MDVKIIWEPFRRLKALIEGKGDETAILNQLKTLEAAIEHFESKPQTYIPEDLVGIPSYWSQWEDLLGYAEYPYVREDNYIVCKYPNKDFYYAKYPDGQFILDTQGRKRTWKYFIRGIACIDRDFPRDKEE